MNIYVYENRQEALTLEPISQTRPAFDLRCGAFTFLERIQKLMPESSVVVFVREELAESTRERFPNVDVNPDSVTDALWLNGTVFWRQEVIEKIRATKNTLFYCGERLVGAYLSAENGQEWLKNGTPVNGLPNLSLNSREISVDYATYLWDCVNLNARVIGMDSPFFDIGTQKGIVDDGVHLLSSPDMVVGEGSRIKAGAILDADEGPIIVGENVTVLPGAYLQGPLVIGDNCLIKAGAKIYGNTTLGPGCKVGGEIVNSIFQSWSNKQHGGFIGDTYIGEWINLGAGTNNSDLKNNYSPAKVTVNGNVVNTGLRFVGLFMGDHSKTGINTMLNTGTSVGPASNIVGFGFPPRAIPPFSWVFNGKIGIYLFEKFIETASIVKERKGQSFSSVEERIYRRLFDDRSGHTSS